MNNPESITVSLEMAKQLAKAGWPQDECRFVHQRANNNWNGGNWFISTYGNYPKVSMAETLAAPTAEEILRRLPSLVMSYIPKNENKILVMNNESGKQCWGNNLADCLAEMYCYLAKNELLKEVQRT